MEKRYLGADATLLRCYDHAVPLLPRAYAGEVSVSRIPKKGGTRTFRSTVCRPWHARGDVMAPTLCTITSGASQLVEVCVIRRGF